MKSTGVIIARFQTPYLHEGHQYLLNEIMERHSKVVVVLGVSPVKGSRKNPLDFHSREKMLKTYNERLVVLPLSDHSSDAAWSRNLDTLLLQTFPGESFMLYGSRDCFLAYYSGQLPTEELPEVPGYSATAIRDAFADKVLSSEDFRVGINYAYQNTYTRAIPAVDVAVLKDSDRYVLLGSKPQTETWRFPGGFVDADDVSYEAAALREMKEECGALVVGQLKYVTSMRVDDWRYRDEADKIMTTLYAARMEAGEPVAQDDLVAVEWFPVSKLADMIANKQIVQEHVLLVQQLLIFLQA